MKAKANILAKPNPYIMVATNAASCLYTLHSLIPDHKPGNVVLSKNFVGTLDHRDIFTQNNKPQNFLV